LFRAAVGVERKKSDAEKRGKGRKKTKSREGGGEVDRTPQPGGKRRKTIKKGKKKSGKAKEKRGGGFPCAGWAGQSLVWGGGKKKGT